MRFEADLRPFVRDGIEMADLYLRHGTHYYDVPFRCLHFVDREPGDTDGYPSPEN